MLNHILIPLDGSELAERALAYAEQIASPGAEITLLTAVDPPEYLTYSMYGNQTIPSGMITPRPGVDYQAIADEMLKDARDYIDRVANRLQKAGYRVHRKIEMGAPAEAILKAAEAAGVDAIVMSTHGRSGLSRWLLGSVTQKVLSAAPCPVFVTPPGERDKK